MISDKNLILESFCKKLYYFDIEHQRPRGPNLALLNIRTSVHYIFKVPSDPKPSLRYTFTYSIIRINKTSKETLI